MNIMILIIFNFALILYLNSIMLMLNVILKCNELFIVFLKFYFLLILFLVFLNIFFFNVDDFVSEFFSFIIIIF